MRDLSSGGVISRLCYLSQTREDVEGNPRWDSHYGSTARQPYWLCSAPAEARDRVLTNQSWRLQTGKKSRTEACGVNPSITASYCERLWNKTDEWKCCKQAQTSEISTHMGLEWHDGEQMIINFLSIQILTMLVAVWKLKKKRIWVWTQSSSCVSRLDKTRLIKLTRPHAETNAVPFQCPVYSEEEIMTTHWSQIKQHKLFT